MTKVSVAYLITQYPAVSHTFIASEIHALEAHGVTVQRFSVRAAAPDLPEDAHEERMRTTVVHDLRLMLVAVASGLWHVPLPMMRVLRQAVLPAHPATAGDRLARVGYVASALVVWRAMRRDLTRHVHVHFSNNACEIARMVCELGRPDQFTWSFTVHSFRMNGLDHTSAQDWPTRNQGRWGPLKEKVSSAAFVACISEDSKARLREIAPRTAPDKLVTVRMGFNPRLFTPGPAQPLTAQRFC